MPMLGLLLAATFFSHEYSDKYYFFSTENSTHVYNASSNGGTQMSLQRTATDQSLPTHIIHMAQTISISKAEEIIVPPDLKSANDCYSRLHSTCIATYFETF